MEELGSFGERPREWGPKTESPRVAPDPGRGNPPHRLGNMNALASL